MDIVAAARGANYQDPAVADRVSTQMNAILIVTGLIISGVYGGLYTGYTGTTDKRINDGLHNWFAWCNYVAFGFAVVAALLALSYLMAGWALLRWPLHWHDLPPPPRSIVEQYTDRFDFQTVNECAQALNFAWHACNYGHTPPRYIGLLDLNVQASYYFVACSIFFSLAAAIIALTAQTSGPASHKFIAAGVAVTLGPPLLLQLLPLLLMGRTVWEVVRPTNIANMDVPLQFWRHHVEDAVQCGCKDNNKALFGARVWYEAGKLAARKHSYLQPVPAAAGFQAEVEAEYSAEIAPILDSLAAWQQAHGPHFAVHVFMDPLLACSAVSKMQALHKFWRRWEAMVTAGAFTADEFFSSSETDDGAVWLARARRFRLLAEPLFIARWYYNNRHYRPAAPTASGGLYRSSRGSAMAQPVLASVSAASAATTSNSRTSVTHHYSRNSSAARREQAAAEERGGALDEVAALAGRAYRQRQYFAVIWEEEERQAARRGEGGAGQQQQPEPSLGLEFLLEHSLGEHNIRFQAMLPPVMEAVGLLHCSACGLGGGQGRAD